MVFAIASKHSILICDTQQPYPIAKISDIHYTKLSDISWSSDGRILIVSSTDGYCTFILFNDQELGEPYEGEPYEFPVPVKEVSSPGQKKREKKEKEQKEQPELPAQVVEKVPEVAKITNFFKKIPVGTIASPPSSPPIKSVVQTIKTNENNNETTTSASVPIKVNQIQVRRKSGSKTAPDPNAKQPRRISLTTLLSNKPKILGDLKENRNTKCDLKNCPIPENEEIELDNDSPDKPSSIHRAKSVEIVETENESKAKTPTAPPSLIKSWILNSNEPKLTDQLSKSPLTSEERIGSEPETVNLGTPQRNKRKSENEIPEELQPNAKKRISLTQIE